MPSAAPETRYTKSGDVNIAYQVVGDGPFDLVYVPGWVSNIALMWEEPAHAHLLRRLASFSRLILFDKRGTGLSDPVPVDRLPTLEQSDGRRPCRLDAAGSERAALLRLIGGRPHERPLRRDLSGADSRAGRASPFTRSGSGALTTRGRRRWRRAPRRSITSSGRGAARWTSPISRRAPTRRSSGAPFAYLRRSTSLGAAVALLRMNTQIDVRDVLPTIRAPTLVLQRVGDHDVKVEEGRWIAAQIPDAKYVELPGDEHLIWAGDVDVVVDEVEEFLTGERPLPEANRVLSTVLFTDVVDSTSRAAELGDRRWRELIGEHHERVRRQLDRFRGREIDTAGDGFFATFDGPARAVRAAWTIRGSVRELGIEIRAGLHTGECELMAEKVGGIAVHTGARVAGAAGPGEVLVSSTVRDLVAGSGIAFEDRGEHELKGVGSWRLYSVVDA